MKNESFKLFLSRLDEFKNRESTAEELIRIHEIMTEKEMVTEFNIEEDSLLILSRSDYADFVISSETDFLEFCRSNSTNVKLEKSRSIRKIGTRIVKGLEEKIYASVLIDIFNDGEIFTFALPDKKVEDMYADICTHYDQITSQKGLNLFFTGQSYLQILGTMLHPFVDGNGRTFLAHLALGLHREGVNVKKYETFSKIQTILSAISSKLAYDIIQNSGYCTKDPMFIEKLRQDHEMQHKYYTNVNQEFGDLVKLGINNRRAFDNFYVYAGGAIYSTLVDEGYLEKPNVEKKTVVISKTIKEI